MSLINILHWSNTPLVGSPSSLAKCINRVEGFEAHHVCEKEYPNNSFLFKEFTHQNIVLNNMTRASTLHVDYLIKKADIIHIHNDIDKDNFERIRSLNDKCAYIYQVHSPLSEGPLFFPRYQKYKNIFDALLVVAQYQPRLYQDFIPVPNIIDKKPSLNLLNDDDQVRVIFSPTHLRKGRWNNKYSKELVDVLISLDKLKLIDYIEINGEKPYSLYEIRRTCHITFDEIVTGAFHQISLEGLIAGNLTINAADFFSKLIFASAIGARELPPFFLMHPSTIQDYMLEIVYNKNIIREWQHKAYRYAVNYLDSDILIHKYINIYKEVLNGTK